jgi:hypothetical protein
MFGRTSFHAALLLPFELGEGGAGHGVIVGLAHTY